MKAIFLAVCVVLAGCGGKSGAPKVRLASVGPGLNTNFLAIPLAQKLGYFEQAGLDVSVETLASSTKAMQAMLGGGGYRLFTGDPDGGGGPTPAHDLRQHESYE